MHLRSRPCWHCWGRLYQNPALQALGAPVTAAAPDSAPLVAATARAAELGREVAGATAALEQLSAVEEQMQVRDPRSLGYPTRGRCTLLQQNVAERGCS